MEYVFEIVQVCERKFLHANADHRRDGADLHGLVRIGQVPASLQAGSLGVGASRAKGADMLCQAVQFKFVLKVGRSTGLRGRISIGNILATVTQAEFAQPHIHRTGGYRGVRHLVQRCQAPGCVCSEGIFRVCAGKRTYGHVFTILSGSDASV